jgi:release factor glutamine methyltransferase
LERLANIYNSNEADIITSWVFEKIAGLNRFDLLKDPQGKLPEEILQQLDRCLLELLQYRPVQYVLGEAWFYKMKLLVNEAVLIPRPETEELVQLIIDAHDDIGSNDPLHILDIGTGSGCIAIALKKNLPGALVYAIDNSASALAVAKNNATEQAAQIEFVQADFLAIDSWSELPVFDIIVSNPPYIPFNEKKGLSRNVKDYEPHASLFVPENEPLLFYEHITEFGKLRLQQGGRIYLEVHEAYAKETAGLFMNYSKVEIRKDLQGKERMLIVGN